MVSEQNKENSIKTEIMILMNHLRPLVQFQVFLLTCLCIILKIVLLSFRFSAPGNSSCRSSLVSERISESLQKSAPGEAAELAKEFLRNK